MKNKEKGFTLVEIMIVIAIIGLLAAIAIPNLLRARVNANEGAVKTDLRAFSTANESYRAVQTPPGYSPDINSLVISTPAYIDVTWNTNPKHGYNMAYSVAAAPANTYALLASPAPGAGTATFYCIDQTGILVGGTAGVTGPAAGCAGGSPIAN